MKVSDKTWEYLIVFVVPMSVMGIFWNFWAGFTGGHIPSNPARISLHPFGAEWFGWNVRVLNRSLDVIALPIIVFLLVHVIIYVEKLGEKDEEWMNRFGAAFFNGGGWSLLGGLFFVATANSPNVAALAVVGIFLSTVVGMVAALQDEGRGLPGYIGYLIGFSIAWSVAIGLLAAGMFWALMWVAPLCALAFAVLTARLLYKAWPVYFAEKPEEDKESKMRIA